MFSEYGMQYYFILLNLNKLIHTTMKQIYLSTEKE